MYQLPVMVIVDKAEIVIVQEKKND